MTSSHYGDGEGLPFDDPSMADFGRIEDLRELVASIEARIEKLRNDPDGNPEEIACEEAALSAARKEVENLESRFSIG